MNRGSIALALGLWLAVSGCGQTLVIRIPDLPFRSSEPPPGTDADQRVQCDFMTILIDYSRHGEIEVADRVARAMEREFERYGVRVTRSNQDAYWSLMILASDNSHGDGYIFSALLSARNMNEGYDPGVTVFQRDGEAVEPSASRQKIPTMYNGLSYGPYETLEDQAKIFVKQAYEAVFPHARELCDFERSDREREQTIDREIPGPPSPL
jgi:hypothetical protein